MECPYPTNQRIREGADMKITTELLHFHGELWACGLCKTNVPMVCKVLGPNGLSSQQVLICEVCAEQISTRLGITHPAEEELRADERGKANNEIADWMLRGQFPLPTERDLLAGAIRDGAYIAKARTITLPPVIVRQLLDYLPHQCSISASRAFGLIAELSELLTKDGQP